MGQRGPQPTPTEILKLRGSTLLRERKKRGEPQPERGVPNRPSSVTKEARAVWTAATKMLDEMGVLSTIDGGPLERYCMMFVQWRQIQRIIAKFSATDDMLAGTLLKDDSRPLIRNAWSESHRLDTALKQIEDRFGLSPAARARLSCLVNGASEPVRKDDDEDRFFGSSAG